MGLGELEVSTAMLSLQPIITFYPSGGSALAILSVPEAACGVSPTAPTLTEFLCVFSPPLVTFLDRPEACRASMAHWRGGWHCGGGGGDGAVVRSGKPSGELLQQRVDARAHDELRSPSSWGQRFTATATTSRGVPVRSAAMGPATASDAPFSLFLFSFIKFFYKHFVLQYIFQKVFYTFYFWNSFIHFFLTTFPHFSQKICSKTFCVLFKRSSNKSFVKFSRLFSQIFCQSFCISLFFENCLIFFV